jgi:hypothetical protein
VNVGHEPDGAWDCQVDGKPWPCDAAREELSDAFVENPVALAEFMATQLGRAASVLFAEPLDVLYERFIAWTRRSPLDEDANVP